MVDIVFLTLNAYDMLTGGRRGGAGGAQLQQILVGQELARRGHKVTFIEHNKEYKTENTINGIDIVCKPKPEGNEVSRGISVLASTYRTLKQLDPDICYRRGLEFHVFPVAAYCWRTDVPFVFGIAHDDELTDNPHKLTDGVKSTLPYKYANRRALASSDAVIAQNETQAALAMSHLGTYTVEIPNCYDALYEIKNQLEFRNPMILWAARHASWKRPELVLKLADEIPEATFVMIGGPALAEPEVFEEIKQQAKSRPNVEVKGYVPFEEVDQYFDAADIFINTSTEEGFPNTFLQAWYYGTPVVSLDVDPNDILIRHRCGIVAGGSFEQLSNELKTLLQSDTGLRSVGKNARQYFETNHNVDTIVDQYESLFESIV